MTEFPSPQTTPPTRRDVLRQGLCTAGAVTAALAGGWWFYRNRNQPVISAAHVVTLPNYFADIDYPTGAPRISIARGSEQLIEPMVRAALLGLDPQLGMKRFIRSGDVVLIKPNIGFDRAPRYGATTNPEVVRAVIRLCREAGATEILVADYPIESAAACLLRSGIRQVCDRENARLLLPVESRFTVVQARLAIPDINHREVLSTWPMFYEPLRRANKVIGVAVVKDHNLCSASMGLKNWYGLLGGRRQQFHQTIHEAVSDLGMLISPTLVINDATRVLMRNGPTGGRLEDVKAAHTVVAGVDPVAVDAWCYENLLERDPANLAYLQYAEEKFGREPYEKSRRFGRRDWKGYARQGLIAETVVN